jgi:predicted nucleotidyltransferase
MKIFLDDLREAPDGWTRAYWPSEVIDLLKGGEVTHLSLDHDLGDDKRGTGYDVLTWIEDVLASDKEFTAPSIKVHTANPPARARMLAAIEEIEVMVLNRDRRAFDWIRERSTPEFRRRMQLMWLQPELKNYLDDLRDAIMAEYGECVDRIVIIGSAVGPGFRKGESDVDVVVLATDFKRPKRAWNEPDFEDEINERFKGTWQRIDITVKDTAKVHLIGTNFSNCYEGQVVRGFIVYDKNLENNAEFIAYDKNQAQQHIVERYMHQAWIWSAGASATSGSCSWSVCRSACRALHAVLAHHDLDFSPKNFRWNLPELCEVAETLSPTLHVKKWVDMLPADLAFIDVDEMPTEDGLDISERRHLIAVGIMVIRAVERLLGVPPAEKSNFFVSNFRRNEKKWMLEEKGE